MIQPTTSPSPFPPPLAKPPHGAPCNKCGLCCLTGPCTTAKLFFEISRGPCPALQWDDRAFVCGLMADPARYAPVRARIKGATAMSQAARRLLGADQGCDARYPDEPADEACKRRLDARGTAKQRQKQRDADQRIWGIAKEAAAAKV
jgi:hypothetical protein